jgi:hypothetical protein
MIPMELIWRIADKLRSLGAANSGRFQAQAAVLSAHLEMFLKKKQLLDSDRMCSMYFRSLVVSEVFSRHPKSLPASQD